jgi:hypothetical protein
LAEAVGFCQILPRKIVTNGRYWQKRLQRLALTSPDSGLYYKDEKEVMYKKSIVVQNKSSLLI